MPAISSWLLEPLWDQCAALLPDRRSMALLTHRAVTGRGIGDRIIFEKLIHVLRFGCSHASDRRLDLPLGQPPLWQP